MPRRASQLPANFVPATGFPWLLPWYDRLISWLLRDSDFRAHLLEQCNGLPTMPDPLEILDAGCGTGTWIEQALQSGSPHYFHGVDIDPRILTQARQKLSGHPRWTLYQSPLADLEFPADRFDLIVCSLVFHHLTWLEKQDTLREFVRLLKPRGYLLLVDLAEPASWLARLQFLPVRLVDGWHRTQANVRGELPGMLSDAGLRDIQQTLQLDTWLGTLRCYQAIHYDALA